MKYLLLTVLTVLFFDLGAQFEQKPVTFYGELDLSATLPTGLDGDDAISSRFGRGGGLNFMVRRRVSPGLSLEVGTGFQFLNVRQRNEDITLGCNLPVDLGGQGLEGGFVDAEIQLSSIILHLAPIIHFGAGAEGVYLKPKLRLNYNIGDQAVGRLFDCNEDEPRLTSVGRVIGDKLSVFPGIGLGYQGYANRGKVAYVEINFAFAAGNPYERHPRDPVTQFFFWEGTSVLIGGITFGWQIGGGKKNRQPKKDRPAPVHRFHSGK